MKAVTEARKNNFLAALKETCNVTEAAKIAGFTARTAYNHRVSDPDFKERWDAVEIEVRDKIEGEIWRRGVEGIDKPIFYQGKPVATVKEYSDRMLELLAKGHMKDRYGDQSKVELTGKDGAPIQDSMEIARRIAFALRQGAGGPPPKDKPETDDETVVH